MSVAYAILCVGGVAFLLRFLTALVKEVMTVPPSAQRILSTLHPTRQ